MFGVIALLIGIAIRLHVDQSKNDDSINLKDNFLKLVFCICLAVFIPSIVGNTFGSTIIKGQIMFYPVFMHVIGTVVTVGLQRLAYGSFYSSIRK